MHERLMERYHELGITSLKGHAREVGVVNKRFLEQLMNSDFGWNVQDDLREGLALGIREIPVLLINGKVMDKPLSLNRVTKTVKEELQVKSRSRQKRAA